MSLAATHRWKAVLIAGLAAMAVGALGTAATDLGPWYQDLVKPSWQPPDWLFGPAWTLIYALAALSAAFAWNAARSQAARNRVLVLFGINALLNVLWSQLFFGLHRPDLAVFEVVLLWLSVLVLIVFLRPISRTAIGCWSPILPGSASPVS